MNQTGDSGAIVTAGGAAAAGAGIFLLVWLALVVLFIVGMWKVFTKAGQPGWGAIIPIYNAYLMCKIAGKPGWWVVLFFIPLVSFIIGIIVIAGVAKNFGKGIGFTLGLIFLSFIFFLILGFGDSKYIGTPA